MARERTSFRRKLFGPESLADWPESIVCLTLNFRRRYDVHLKRGPKPENWLGWQLWQSPEATIIAILEQHAWLTDGGLTDAAAWARITEDRAFTMKSNPLLEQGVRAKLAQIYPDYLALDQRVLQNALQVAIPWVTDRVAQQKAEPFPPVTWFGEVVDQASDELSKIPSGKIGPKIQALFVEGDEWRRFCSPPDSWGRMCGREGVALVRRGKAIAYGVTRMN